MKIEDINTIRLALDTPEHCRSYEKNMADALEILNSFEDKIEGKEILPIGSGESCNRCNTKQKHKNHLYCVDCLYERVMLGY